MPGQVLAYVRVSMADQTPDRQVSAICDGLRSEPDRWFTDHASGASTDRPALTAMLQHVRDEDTLVVSSMDRLARSVVDLDRLVTQLTGEGVTVRFLKEGLTFQPSTWADPLAVFQLQVMGAFAQLERALIRDRQREGIAAAKARGVYRRRPDTCGWARRYGTDPLEPRGPEGTRALDGTGSAPSSPRRKKFSTSCRSRTAPFVKR
jgi:DNA invertase Pin-like site-specific DNA recombinase